MSILALQDLPSDAIPIDMDASLYGLRIKTKMEELSASIRPIVHAVVDQFYRQLSRLSGSQHLIACLSGEELDHMKIKQAENLLMLCSPDLTHEMHKEVALRVGRIHAIVGLSREQLVTSNDVLHAVLLQNVDGTAHAQSLLILARRLVRDLGWQMTAAQNMQILCSNVLFKLGNLAWHAESYTDLITRAAEILGALDGVVGCVFARPDAQGIFKVEAIGGAKTVDFIAHVEKQQRAWLQAGEDPLKPGTGMWAWESRRIARCFNYATDPRVAHWLPCIEEAGYRSGITLPLDPLHEKNPAIVLFIYSGLPGGFSSPEQDAFFSQVKALLTFGLSKLEAFNGTVDTIPYATRKRWQSLLHGSGLEMHYQPVVELRTGSVVKVEALARLRDGDDILTPDTFLPALTSQDLFTLYVSGLDHVLAQRNAWISQGVALGLAINLPASALGNARYVEATRKALDRHNCPPDAITLEILETEEVSPDVDLLSALLAYKKLGVQLAEDDLGSGYSTLARLREMPVDVIKIDRSIVRNAEQDPYNTLRFIYQLTRLGHGLGKRVVVEGVEDMALLQALSRLRVDCAQGYAIAKPMPAAELELWLRLPRILSFQDDRKLTHTLARLADALVWEEGLHVIREETPLNGGKESVLAGFYAAMVDTASHDSAEKAAKTDLTECAIKFGLNSNEYMAARNRLIALLVQNRPIASGAD